MNRTSAVLGALVAATHVAACAIGAQTTSQEGILEVSGTAQVSVPVDQAIVLLAVETEAQDAESAVAENATLMEAVVAALSASDAEGLQLETTGFNLQPVYGRPIQGQPRQIEGYRAFNNLSVTIDDVEAVGALLDLAVTAGANRIASLSFRARDTDAARREALRRAVQMARAEAEAIAEALGQPLGEPLEVRGGAQRPVQPRAAMAAFEAQAVAATPVEIGDQTVTASVTIKYRLGSEPGGS